MRPNEEPDPRILMVIATPEDIAQQSVKAYGESPSLSDNTLALLLEKLQSIRTRNYRFRYISRFPRDNG